MSSGPTWFLLASFLNASVRKAPAAALCTLISVDSRSTTRGGIPPSVLWITNTAAEGQSTAVDPTRRELKASVAKRRVHETEQTKRYICLLGNCQRYHEELLPYSTFNVGILMCQISYGVCCPPNDAIHRSRIAWVHPSHK